MEMINIQTESGKIFILERELAKKSIMLKNIISDAEESAGDAIPIQKVEDETLEQVIRYLELTNSNIVDEKSLKDRDLELWEKEYTESIKEIIFPVILAANFLDIRHLLDVCCKAVANTMVGKTPKQIREMYGIVNDFTPEQEEEMKNEIVWCMDL
jgi:S-phase kinase-associated protein 1